jgi:hypothetical protein
VRAFLVAHVEVWTPVVVSPAEGTFLFAFKYKTKEVKKKKLGTLKKKKIGNISGEDKKKKLLRGDIIKISVRSVLSLFVVLFKRISKYDVQFYMNYN